MEQSHGGTEAALADVKAGLDTQGMVLQDNRFILWSLVRMVSG